MFRDAAPENLAGWPLHRPTSARGETDSRGETPRPTSVFVIPANAPIREEAMRNKMSTFRPLLPTPKSGYGLILVLKWYCRFPSTALQAANAIESRNGKGFGHERDKFENTL